MDTQNTTQHPAPKGGSEPIKPHALQDEIVKALNSCLGSELGAYYFHACASDWAGLQGHKKCQKFFAQEAQAELQHADKIRAYLVDWNSVPVMPPVQFDVQFSSLVDVFNKAYKMEYGLGETYNKVSLSVLNAHPPTFDFLSFYRNTQMESIVEYSDLLNSLMLVDASSKLDLYIWEQNTF